MNETLLPTQFRDGAGRLYTVPPWKRSDLWAALLTVPDDAAEREGQEGIRFRVRLLLRSLLDEQRRACGITEESFAEGLATPGAADRARAALLAAEQSGKKAA